MSVHASHSAALLQGATPIKRVLVVDDSRVQLRIMSSILRRWDYHVWEASSGQQALDLCAEVRPDLVLSDWMMPGMDGLEFCRRFRVMTQDRYGYFILLTSKSEKGEIVLGLDAGADDFLSKPVNSDELRARINAGARVLAMQRELAATLGKLQKLYDDIDKDLQQARLIQESLVPRRRLKLENGTVSLLLKPCGHVGGDLVGMFTPGRNRLGVYSIDVSGHGITSALVTARMAGYLSAEHFDENLALERRFEQFFALRPPEQVAGLLNRRLTNDRGVAEYLTMAYATIDLQSGDVSLVQAGHPPPLLLCADGSHRFVGNGGLPIGLVDDAQYDRIRFRMQPGDRLILYSDGLTECEIEGGQMLEEDGLARLALATPHRLHDTEYLDDLYWRLCQTRAPVSDHADDISAAMLEFTPDQPG